MGLVGPFCREGRCARRASDDPSSSCRRSCCPYRAGASRTGLARATCDTVAPSRRFADAKRPETGCGAERESVASACGREGVFPMRTHALAVSASRLSAIAFPKADAPSGRIPRMRPPCHSSASRKLECHLDRQKHDETTAVPHPARHLARFVTGARRRCRPAGHLSPPTRCPWAINQSANWLLSAPFRARPGHRAGRTRGLPPPICPP